MAFNSILSNMLQSISGGGYYCIWSMPLDQVFGTEATNQPTVYSFVGIDSDRGIVWYASKYAYGTTISAARFTLRDQKMVCGARFEKHYGKVENGSLCVMKAMQHELAQNLGIKVAVLYYQPAEFFRPASIEEKHRWPNFSVAKVLSGEKLEKLVDSCDPNGTLFTSQVGNGIFVKRNRPALIVSSTNWTPDEDFGILLEAAVMYDRRVAVLLDEEDSTGQVILSNEVFGGSEFLYPRISRPRCLPAYFLIWIGSSNEVFDMFGEVIALVSPSLSILNPCLVAEKIMVEEADNDLIICLLVFD
ncbi:UDP-glycosyltransferase TURAN-like [Actinidia eriantha]|uniref:UDP-glycosyltransferase TURAN-like n=1 Tax=Actinidia eriantha TaxID=165200 RepID=UPI00258764E9|nr:UDP-glycosyltransferase TURAN-like [Actinidia eriantha]